MKAIKIKRMIQEGEFGDQAKTSKDILDNGGAVLDNWMSDYTPTLFEGKDGKYYVATVEVVIGEATKSYVKSVLADLEDDSE